MATVLRQRLIGTKTNEWWMTVTMQQNKKKQSRKKQSRKKQEKRETSPPSTRAREPS